MLTQFSVLHGGRGGYIFKPIARSLEHKNVHGGGEVIRSPSTFDTNQPINMIFGTYSEFPLYFQLSETTWCLIGFHGNHSYINDVVSGLLLDF